MSVQKNPNGSWLITDIVEGQYIKQVYYFYCKKDAIEAFKYYRDTFKHS